MFRAAGIPSLYVSGLGSSVGVFDETHTGQGHAWNVVYYNGTWHYMDLTWDCNNQYWGEGSSKNKSGQKCTYDNYGIPAYRMGLGHKPSERGAVSYSNTVKGIIVEDTKEKFGRDCKFITEIPIVSEDIAEPYKAAGLNSINGRIDLLIVDKNGNAHIRDFKVSRKAVGA